jgi:hypothetical protein
MSTIRSISQTRILWTGHLKCSPVVVVDALLQEPPLQRLPLLPEPHLTKIGSKSTFPHPAAAIFGTSNALDNDMLTYLCSRPPPRPSTRIPSERALAEARKRNTVPEDDDTIYVEVPETADKEHLDDFEYDDGGSKKKSKRKYHGDREDDDMKSKKPRGGRYSIDPEYVNYSDDTDEEELVEQRVRYQHEQRRPRDPVDVRIVERATTWQQVEDAALEKSYGKGKGRAESVESTSNTQRPPRYPARLGLTSASSPRPSQAGRASGFSFDDAIAQAYEQRQNSKRQAEERRLQAEQKAAWDNNPTIKKLLEEGKVQEAEEMMDAATELLMIQRGMK